MKWNVLVWMIFLPGFEVGQAIFVETNCSQVPQGRDGNVITDWVLVQASTAAREIFLYTSIKEKQSISAVCTVYGMDSLSMWACICVLCIQATFLNSIEI